MRTSWMTDAAWKESIIAISGVETLNVPEVSSESSVFENSRKPAPIAEQYTVLL